MPSPLDAALSDQPAIDLVRAETPAEAPAEPQAPARGPDGKFVSKQAEAAETPLPASPTLPPEGGEKPEPGHVPLSAMLDEREKRQAAEKSLRELRSNLERQRAEWQSQNPPSDAERAEMQRYADNLRFSRKFAEREYGKDLIAAVHDWVVARCDADPRFNEEMRASDDPYESAVQAYNREQILSGWASGDLDAFKAWKAAQAELGQANASPPPTPAPAPPRSLATAPGAGAAGNPPVNVGEGEAFKRAFT